MKITRTDPFTGEAHTLDIGVSIEQLNLWKSGVLIQDAMPNIEPEDREFIKTGITPESWDATFNNQQNKE
jgi:hypothetical protein